MAKREFILGIIITLSLILGSGLVSPVAAETPGGSHLRLVSFNDQEAVLELIVDDFQIETVEHEGKTYQRLVIPGTAHTDRPGEPQVPIRGTLLGLLSTEGVAVQVLDAQYETLNGYHLYPAPGLKILGDTIQDLPPEGVQQTFALNQALYANHAFYPGRPVEISHTGIVRGQAVAQMRFYPVQYNPVTGEVRLYRRILARIKWDMPPSIATADARGTSPAYEKLLQKTLLNYAALQRPSVTRQSPPPPAGTTDIITADLTPTLKIGVTQDGMYQITPDDLAGFSLSGVATNTLKMKNRGIEIPSYVHDDGNGIFDGSDYLLFYGTAITDIYTIKNIYWLEAGGSNGQRMGTRDGTPSGGTVPSQFPATLHIEEDTYYWQLMPNGEGQDHWFWESKLSAPESRDYPLTLNNVASSTATVRVRLKGYTVPTHHSTIYLNGLQIDTQAWDGQITFDHEVTTSHLISGSNVIRVEAPSIGLNQFFVNWIEIDYWDSYVAENDQLFFGAPGGGTFQFEVDNFSSASVDVFDVTDPADVTRIINSATVPHGGGYQLQFTDTAQSETRYLALTPEQRQSPASIELDQPSSWKSASHGADYVIITHEDFYTETLALASQRSASGLSTATVKIEDVYDEFNEGIFNPGAIRDFLSYAYQYWSPAPTYVLLVGDAHYDYKDSLNQGITNYVPSQVIEDSFGQTVSDNWFVSLDGGDDILPDMFIGRLAVQTASEASDIVDKIIYYEQNPPDASWNTKALLVADDGQAGDADPYAFETTSDQLADRLPFYYTPNKVYVRYYPPGDPTTDLTNAINSGSILVNYAGHGSVNLWGRWSGGRIFSTDQFNNLNNTYKLPVVTVADCLNGYFVGNDISMAEKFHQLPDKGAVAVWAPTGLGYPAGHRTLLREFYDAIFQDDIYALGVSTTAAKFAVGAALGEMVQTFVLFGDPAMELGIPANYPYVQSTTPINGATDVPFNQDIQIVFSKPMSPTSVVLSGPGTAGLVFTPTWNSNYMVLSYDHTDFGEGETLSFTISGQDKLGNSLGPGPVPSMWTFTTITAPDGVTISGPTAGAVQAGHAFTAAVSPTTTLPVTYVWEATDQTPETHIDGDLTDNVTFTWDTPGTKTITVTATNEVGTAADTYDVTITYAPPISVDIIGPTQGITQTGYTFAAAVTPITTTQPISYVWQAAAQVPVTHTNRGLSDTISFTWDLTGTQAVTVTAINVVGVVTDTHAIDIDETTGTNSVYLPIVIRNN